MVERIDKIEADNYTIHNMLEEFVTRDEQRGAVEGLRKDIASLVESGFRNVKQDLEEQIIITQSK